MKHPRELRTELVFTLLSALLTPAALAQTKPRVKEMIQPIQVIHRNDGVYFVDFGSDSFAQLELKIAAPAVIDAKRKLTIRLGEKLADTDHIDAKPGGSIRFLESVVTTEAGKTSYYPKLTPNDARDMPADIGPVMPFRYAEISNLPDTTTEELKSVGVRQIAVHYPFDDSASDFSCSDDRLNAIWKLCKHSIKTTSFAGLFIDGDRERKPYEADAYINQLGWYYCTDDITLPRHTQQYLITHPTWPTEWIMFSVMSAWEEYLYTGDVTTLKTNYDDLKAKTLRGLERDDGLISPNSDALQAVTQAVHLKEKLKDIVDWPANERDGYQMKPVNTVVNAFHCHVLQLMARIATVLNKTDEAADFNVAAAKTFWSLNSRLFNSQTGLYVDGEGSDHSSLHANMFPLAFGLVPADRQEKVVAYIKSRGMACSVYGAQFLLDALFDNAEGDQAIILMTDAGDRSWRHMVEEVGTTITLEAWDNKYKPNQDWNHAWGSAPANLLPAKVLGVEPLEPGYAKVLVWPRCAGSTDQTLTWAKGKVPTIRGPILVDWKKTGSEFHLIVNLPPGVTAEARLPKDYGVQAKVDGSPSDIRSGEKFNTLQLTAGQHEIVLLKK